MATAGRTTQAGFRKLSWGATEAEVRAAERAALIQETRTHLVYESQLFGAPCHVVYFFEEGKLQRGRYVFTHESLDEARYAYKALRVRLIEKYGEPDNPYELQCIGGIGSPAARYEAALEEHGMPPLQWSNAARYHVVSLEYTTADDTDTHGIIVEHYNTINVLLKAARRSAQDRELL
jgi:hypothetical protein